MDLHSTDHTRRTRAAADVDGMLTSALYGALTGLVLGLWWMAAQLLQ